MMNARIRLAAPDDAPALAAIYAPSITETVASFEAVPPTADEMRKRVIEVMEGLPWLVAEIDGQAAGYAYAGKHHARAAYQWSVDTTVYISSTYHRRGVGRALYTALLDLLTMQGYFTAFAGITLPNPASVGLHEALGFTPVGVYSHAGFKHGAWRDVGWWQRPLRPYETPTASPLSLREAVPTVQQETVFQNAARHLSR